MPPGRIRGAAASSPTASTTAPPAAAASLIASGIVRPGRSVGADRIVEPLDGGDARERGDAAYSGVDMWRPLDTTDDARRRQIAILRSMSPSQRVAIAASMTDEVRSIAEAGIQHRHPEWSPEQRATELAAILRRSDRP